MGGTIRVILREENGTIHKMFRWTNSFPWFVNHMGLVNKDPKHLKAYMRAYVEMKIDYLKNKDKPDVEGEEKFENFMTSAYFPEADWIAPAGYGLLVIDYMKDKILSCQGYSHVGNVDMGKLRMALDDSEENRFIRSGMIQDDEIESYKTMLEEGRIAEHVMWDLKEEGFVSHNRTKEEILGFTSINFYEDKSEEARELKWSHFKLDLNPWEVFNYDESVEGYAEFKEKMVELGFEFTEEDEKLWNEYVSCYQDV